MSDERKGGLGHTVLGWFIEKDATGAGNEVAYEPSAGEAPGASGGSDASAAEAAIIARAGGTGGIAGSSAVGAVGGGGAYPAPAGGAPVPPGNLDFESIFDAAGIAAEERGQVERAQALLADLPAEAPAAVKKQVVAAALKAFGIPIERIIEASAQEIQALEGYIQNGAAQAESFRAEAERKVATFQQEIERIRTAAESRVREQQGVVSACNSKKLEVQQILEFFGQEAVAQVVRDSPKLQSPPETSG
jgi:hypothetical protein